MQNKQGSIYLTSGVQKRNFIYIDDILLAYNLIIEESKNLKNYIDFDVATNHLIEVRDFIRLIAREIEERSGIDVQDRLDFGAMEYRKNDVMQPDFDNSKIYKLGWIPTVEIELGIKKVLESYYTY